MIVGITGHQDIPYDALEAVEEGIAQELARFIGPIGLSSLAAGADQIFAKNILRIGGRLHVILPCKGYEGTFSDKEALSCFRELLTRAERVEELEYDHPSEEAFLDAGRRIVDLADVLVAVWDGREARGKGGTADIVRYARAKRIKIAVIWPPSASR